MIRRATAADRDVIVTMSLKFQATTNYARHLHATAATLSGLVDRILGNDEAALFLAERAGVVVGMFAAMLYTHPMSGARVGSELCWWMDPDARGGRAALRLLRTAEQWAREHGATVFQMMAPTPAVERFYAALHYDRIEVHFQRRIA